MLWMELTMHTIVSMPMQSLYEVSLHARTLPPNSANTSWDRGYKFFGTSKLSTITSSS